MEAADLTGLVIRALGMIVGKTLRDEGVTSDTSTKSVTNAGYTKKCFVPSALIVGAAQTLIESEEIDIKVEDVSPTKVGRALTKMRFTNLRQGKGGKRGWLVSLNDVIRWASSYGIDPGEITGLHISTHVPSSISDSRGTGVTSDTQPAFNRLRGEI